MKFCIQDPVNRRVYLANENDLGPWAADPDDYSAQVDVLLIVPSNELLQELPATRLTDETAPIVQIVDPNRNKSWVLSSEDLEKFSVDTAPADEGDIAWFAMPTARELIAAVPVFRKALVQHGS